ncbi:uncharacterized protein [Antedon mediterranea]|uniref:uncharacterized protein n=1 Tax=Antedon mediterranea TaxID=105859 RepID=UPI003AF6A13F
MFVIFQDGLTPLHLAAQYGHTDVCTVLLKAGAKLDLQAKDGWTPLHSAANNGKTDVCTILLKAGANLDLTTNDGNTPLLLAASVGQTASCIALAQHADLNRKNQNGDNVMQVCARANIQYEEHRNIFVFFIQEGSMDIYNKNKEGKSALDCYNENSCDKYDKDQKKEIINILKGGPLPFIDITSSDITTKELINIATTTIDWKQLAVNLEFTMAEIDHFKQDNPDDKYKMTYNMLDAWAMKLSTSESKRSQLVKALMKSDEKELANNIENMHVPEEILARGPDAVKAFQNALEEGQTEFNQGRTIFVGLENVGKTSTINSLLRKEFNPLHIITDAMVKTTVCTPDASNKEMLKETTHDICKYSFYSHTCCC